MGSVGLGLCDRSSGIRAEELGLDVSWPVVVQVDNKQAQSFQQGTCVQSKIRGTFDMRESWVQELKDKSQVQVEHVPGAHNCADLMSKAHRTCRFQQLLNSITNKCCAFQSIH